MKTIQFHSVIFLQVLLLDFSYSSRSNAEISVLSFEEVNALAEQIDREGLIGKPTVKALEELRSFVPVAPKALKQPNLLNLYHYYLSPSPLPFTERIEVIYEVTPTNPIGLSRVNFSSVGFAAKLIRQNSSGYKMDHPSSVNLIDEMKKQTILGKVLVQYQSYYGAPESGTVWWEASNPSNAQEGVAKVDFFYVFQGKKIRIEVFAERTGGIPKVPLFNRITSLEVRSIASPPPPVR